MGPPSRKLEICTPPCSVTERPELEERPTNDNIRQKPPGRNLPNWHKRFSCARSAQSSLFRVSVCVTIWREGVEEVSRKKTPKPFGHNEPHPKCAGTYAAGHHHHHRALAHGFAGGGAGAGVGHNNARVSEPVDWNWHSCFGVYTGP